jgi:GPH family glycoside/pentoside/hexuronide:cation symporter
MTEGAESHELLEERIPIADILTWASPVIGVGFMFFLVSMYLMKFSTDVLLIAPGVMGLIFGLSRLWDAVSDPVAGFLSDRTRTRLGRRRPWLLASVVPIAVIFLMLWNPPRSLSGGGLVAWMGIGVLGFYTAMTIFGVPHVSLGAELSKSYDDRNRIFGWRHLCFIAGAFMAVLGLRLLIQSEAPRATAQHIAIAASVATVAVILFCVARVRERPEYQGRGATNPFAAFGDIWRNPHARLLLAVVLIEHLGSATITILTPYASEYRIGTPELTWVYIFCYMAASASTVLIWVRLAKRFDKRRLWMFSLALSGLAFGGMFLAGEGDWLLIVVLCLVGGTAGGCGAVVSPSIQSDVIDYDEYQTGQRKEGAYFAAWNFVFKASAGVTLMITGFVLQIAGFRPNVEQTETARFAIGALFALLPMVCLLSGAALCSRFRLNREEHARIAAVLEARRLAES